MHSSAHELIFRKSSYSGRGDNCVEVADAPGRSAVRDTQNREAGHLSFSSSEWSALLAGVRSSE
ncbi:DUF397 domain-containing protein [Nocardiopsis kunsanensis]|uniref:DUF397 domain-containing protein n=1 Tax=Nocardiopsis kunsanensis TaxID=141693 RepID=UPI000345F74D|nr:DUF397 domain-containing protein [Nocardiopsis kunsanensis]